MKDSDHRDITVAVTTFNRKGALKTALESLIAQTTGGRFTFEIVTVDNGSTDGTIDIVDSISRHMRFPLRYVREEIPGVGPARNRAVRESRGDWIAFFDDDQVADPDWLEKLYDAACSSGASCIGGKVALSLPAGLVWFQSPVGRAVLGETFHGEALKVLVGKPLPGTGNVLMKRAIFQTVGPFDETLLMGSEDADLFRRVRNAGIDIWYTPDAVVHHHIPPYRLEEEYLLWTSKRHGINYALLDAKEGGTWRVILSCLLRAGKAISITLPRLAFASFQGDHGEVIGQRCLLSRTTGYVRQTMFLFSPKLFAQKGYFSAMMFRKERSHFGERQYQGRS
jgi:GT2 family glycosyltransferase